MSWLSRSAQSQHQSQSRSKMQQYRVQIRDKQLNALKNSIRQEMLRSDTIDDLLQNLPKNIQEANDWARELYQAYSQTRRYSLSNQHIIDIFKVVEKFSSRSTLLLFEVVVLRATRPNADALFQYDVMRVLHGFISFTGRNQLIRCPSSTFSIEEGKIINEMVVSSIVQNIERNSAEEDDYTSRLESARITLRVIAEVCRKAPHVRNFAVINHKTYTYCLNAHKCFQKDIENQFYNFLEAATYIPFDRFQDQFNRIYVKIIHLFYRAKMSVRIELLAEEEERSYLTAYESLVKAMRNLFMMGNQWVLFKLQGMENHQGTVTLAMILDIIAQCNYVMEFPAAHEQNETLMPIKLMQAALDLGMCAIEAMSRPFPSLPKHPLYEQYASELIRFLRNRDISFGYGGFVLARRMAIFQLDTFIFQIKQDQAKLHNFIAFNQHNCSDNMIALIAYLMRSDTDINNKIELCILLRHVMEFAPACVLQPFISTCQIFRIMLDRLVQIQTWCGDSLQSSQQVLKANILHVLLTFLKTSLPQITIRIPFYASLIGQYTHRIQNLLLQQHMRQLQSCGAELLEWLADHASEL